MFTVQTAIDRLSGGAVNAFKNGISDAQKLQQINQCIERFYEFGSWRGLHDTITLSASASNILSLSSSYLRLDALSEPSANRDIPIKSQQWAFSPGGPGQMDWTKYGDLVAIDMGDVSNGTSSDYLTVSGTLTPNKTGSYFPLGVTSGPDNLGVYFNTATKYFIGQIGDGSMLIGDNFPLADSTVYWQKITAGLAGAYSVNAGTTGTATVASVATTTAREYRLTGSATLNDARVLQGLARKRFNWFTNTSSIVSPDSFQALRLGVLAMGFEDARGFDTSENLFAEAFKILNGNLVEFNAPQSYGTVQFERAGSMGEVAGVM